MSLRVFEKQSRRLTEGLDYHEWSQADLRSRLGGVGSLHYAAGVCRMAPWRHFAKTLAEQEDCPMNCNCENLFELNGNEALEYAEEHLNKIRVDGENWQVLYECPHTRIQWLKDYPHSEYHGGGSPRLRKMPIESEK